MDVRYSTNPYLMHYGVQGMKWGVRKYVNYDGTLTAEGRRRYGTIENAQKSNKSIRNAMNQKGKYDSYVKKFGGDTGKIKYTKKRSLMDYMNMSTAEEAHREADRQKGYSSGEVTARSLGRQVVADTLGSVAGTAVATGINMATRNQGSRIVNQLIGYGVAYGTRDVLLKKGI